MYYAMTKEDIERIRRVMLRLFTEGRMDGDAMRDAAQALLISLEAALEFEDSFFEGSFDHSNLEE